VTHLFIINCPTDYCFYNEVSLLALFPVRKKVDLIMPFTIFSGIKLQKFWYNTLRPTDVNLNGSENLYSVHNCIQGCIANKKVQERIQKDSHFKTASYSF